MRCSEKGPEINGLEPAMTLQELGVPCSLALEMEGALRALGEGAAARRWRVFVTPDGAAHPLRLRERSELPRAAKG